MYCTCLSIYTSGLTVLVKSSCGPGYTKRYPRGATGLDILHEVMYTLHRARSRRFTPSLNNYKFRRKCSISNLRCLKLERKRFVELYARLPGPWRFSRRLARAPFGMILGTGRRYYFSLH